MGHVWSWQDAEANLTISSPLEAHKPRAIIHSIVGVDVGFENPLFAALEVDYTESDQDSTGAAFDSAEKVSWFQDHTTSPSGSDPLYRPLTDVDLLRTRPWTESRCAKMEWTYGSSSESTRTRSVQNLFPTSCAMIWFTQTPLFVYLAFSSWRTECQHG